MNVKSYAPAAGWGTDWAEPAKAAFELWISLWPAAPLFGVEWRFGDMATKWSSMSGLKVVNPFAGTVRSVGADEPSVPESLMVEAPADADDLTRIKGVGPALATQLNGLGVYKLSQLAGFSTEDLRWIDANLSSFRGRCFRDDWIGQAKALLG